MRLALAILIILFLVSGLFIINTNLVLAEIPFEQGLNKTAEGAGYETGDGGSQLDSIIGLNIKYTLTFLGVIFLILMIYGGYLWMTAQGNEEQVTKAKNLISAAVIGLIIVVAAYAISYFVISKLGNETLELE
jgi:amino acid transporter